MTTPAAWAPLAVVGAAVALAARGSGSAGDGRGAVRVFRSASADALLHVGLAHSRGDPFDL
jgi:hypothetical protein